MTSSRKNNVNGASEPASTVMSSVDEPPTAQQVVGASGSPLTLKALWTWGAAGGISLALVTNGLFDRDKILEMIEGSRPETQVATIVVLCVVMAWAGGLWAAIHKPLYSAVLAFQLGILAPAAIHALIAAANINLDSEKILTGTLVISKAYAQALTTEPSKPTVFECIVKALVKRPC